jgi:non-specific serine/threonine protein kinase/serine/threonine-protein kinase
MFERGFESSFGEAENVKPGIAREHPSVIGRYQIIGLIGEGGMGLVYEAEQEHPRRTVALKIIRPGMASPELLRRFELESQALGRLQHPGIAQIYEAGTADTGFGPQPYFAMEFIDGTNVKAYAEQQGLTTRQRLKMVSRIAEAVHHAHQRGLIHRDLKPANILVDRSGQPKILDFGVARATDSDAQGTNHRTDMGQLIGTLAYMSPEQVVADPLGLDIRSDVYALGVILYELLAGKLPYPVSKNFHETVQTIREEDPLRLSQVSRSYRGDIETIVAKALEKDKTRRYGTAAELAADIARYLKDEPIVARRPNIGYQVQKFARRHKAFVTGVAAVFIVLLGGIVVSARQASVARQERDNARQAEVKAEEERARANTNEREAKNQRDFAQSERNRALETERQARIDRDEAVAQKKRADTEAEIATAVREFVARDLLGMADPAARSRLRESLQGRNSGDEPLQGADSGTVGPDITIKQVLDRASRNIGSRFEKQPLVEAAIRETIAETYFGIGLYANAREHFTKAVALRSRAQGPDSVETLKTMVRLASSLSKLRQWGQAEALIEDIFERRPRGPIDNPPMVEAIDLLWSNVVSGGMDYVWLRFSRAPALLKNFIAVERKTFGNGTEEMSAAVTGLVSLYRNQRPPWYVEMEALLKELHQARRRELGDGNSSTQSTLRQLISVYREQTPQRDVEAERLLKDLVDDQRRNLGDEHSATIFTINQLVNLYVSRPEPQVAQADKFLRPLLEEQRRKLGDSNRATMATMGLLVRVLLNQPQPRYAEAEVLLQSLLNSQVQASGNRNGAAVSTANQLAELYFKQGRYLEAEKLLAPIVATETKNKASNKTSTSSQDVAIANSIDRLFQIYTKLGRTQEAEAAAAQLRSFLKTITSGFASGSSDENLFGPVSTLANFARQLWAQGRDKDADDVALTVLEGYRNIAKSNPRSGAIPTLLLSAASTALTAPDKQAKLEKLANDILEFRVLSVSLCEKVGG